METRSGRNIEIDNMPSRTSRNQDLYTKISESEIGNVRINPNASIIDNNAHDIDIEELKSILDRKYRDDSPKRKSIFIDSEVEKPKVSEVDTKEYDINAVIEAARNEKEDNYDKARLNKLNNTQLDILKKLQVKTETTVVEEEKESDELLTLINTITAKELVKESGDDPLDLFADLKGSDNTVVIPPIKEESTLNKDDNTLEIDKSFYTDTMGFTENDFDGFEDLKNDTKGNNAIIYVLITLAVIALLIGAVILLNKFLNLGLF